MLIKPADDKSKRLALLEALQQSSLLDRRQKEWARDERYRTQRGIKGERDAAHYLDNYLRDDPDRAVLHDLRFQVDGDTVQIDHLIITRSFYVYLLETKNFNGNLHINEQGEFTVEYSGERLFGIPSPLEQSRRHEGPLRKLFGALGLQGRAGFDVQFHHCVLVNPSSQIHRPPKESLDTSRVFKADQFRAWHEKFAERRMGVGEIVGSLVNFRGADTIKEFAQKLARQHRPADMLALPEFMQPKAAVAAPAAPAASTAAVSRPVLAAPAQATAQLATPAAGEGKRQLVCASCSAKISFAEGRFCWNNERRFGGQQYCREHQAQFAKVSAPAQ